MQITESSMSQLPQSPKTLVVTGGAGFIGSNFILYWLEKYPDDSIINIDALTYAGNLHNLDSVSNNPRYSFVKADICDAVAMNAALAGADAVVHFAAESHVDRSIKDPARFLQTNVLGTQVLLDAALKHNVKRFHHISTDEVFGTLELGSEEKFTESTPYSPRSPYSASKAGSDHIVRAYGETYGLDYTISNCSNNYGPLQFPEKLLPMAITSVIEGKPIPIYGDGNYIRDWLFVKDHCSAIEKILLEAPSQSTYVVGGLQKDITNLELAKIILKLMGASDDQLTFVTDRPGHDRRYSVDWQAINRDLGWQPSVTLEQGLQQTIDWYKNNQQWWQDLKTKNKEYFAQQYSRQ
ncbi:MAG: dTDP-glucose 4,6-dehydratase [Patescibacteria group bacterium]|nr:dTDP-glucose 4,6-dehydratase [Patescibacteria group bacterium]